MSDGEESYEYEYDDDDNDVEMDDDEQFEYTDEEEEVDDVDVALENAYYNAKGMRENGEFNEAAEAFDKVLQLEADALNKNDDDDNDPPKFGPWSYKAIKQLVKLHLLKTGNAQEAIRMYERMLECIASPGCAGVSPNAVEKGVNGMLDRVSSSSASQDNNSSSSDLAQSVYDATLRVFHPTSGSCPNERLWFKTNLKYGQLLYEMKETNKLTIVIRDLLQKQHQQQLGSSTNLMEIYALQIQLYSRLNDNKKLRQIFQKAMRVEGGIPHPRTLALIQELGGKMHMASREFEHASVSFYQAFKSYDEAGDPARLRCLKYLVMASMLHASSINPFDSQEARPYRHDPEIVAMTNLVQAFHNHEIETFERILSRNEGQIMNDEFIRDHLADLLRTIRTQVLIKIIAPYQRISLSAISHQLNHISVDDVENLLVALILDGKLDGRIDQVHGILEKTVIGNSTSTTSSINTIPSTAQTSSSMMPSTSDDSAPSSSTSIPPPTWGSNSMDFRNHASLHQLTTALESYTQAVTKTGHFTQHAHNIQPMVQN